MSDCDVKNDELRTFIFQIVSEFEIQTDSGNATNVQNRRDSDFFFFDLNSVGF